MLGNSNNKRSGGKYLPVEQTAQEEEEEGALVSRYRILASGPFPALVDCTFQSSSNDKNLMQACVVGGVLWKLQQFCRKGQDTSKFWKTHGILLSIYVLLILCLGLLLDGKTAVVQEDDESAEVATAPLDDENNHNHNRWMVGVGLLVLTALYFLTLVFLGAGLWISQTFRTKLETFVQEVSEQQLEPLGLKLALEPSRGWMAHLRSSHIHIALKKRTSQPIHSLPPVTPEFQKWIDQQPQETTKATVESILYYGGHSPSLSNARGPLYPLPVDDWIAGGILMRLRKDRKRASQCSRLLAMLVFIPIGVISILHLILGSSDNSEDDSTAEEQDNIEQTTTNLHNSVVAFVIGGCLTLAYLYFREFLDGSSLHAVSRSVVKQFSGLAKERHDVNLQYEVQPGDCLPRTTKGVIRFQPDAIAAPEKKLTKATLAFV